MTGLFGCLAALLFAAGLVWRLGVPAPLRPWLILVGTLAALPVPPVLRMLFGIAPGLVDATLLCAGAGLALAVRTSPPLMDVPGGVSSPGHRRAVLICLAAGLVATAALISHLVRFPDGGNDAFIIWNLRARWLYRSGYDLRSAVSPDILFWTHQDYPLLLPALVARGFELAGGERAIVPGVVAFLFTAGAVGIVASGTPRELRPLAGLALVSLPALVMLGATEQADLPVAAFTAAATAILVSRRPGDVRALFLAGAFASMSAWTKNEGLLLLVVIFAAVVLDERRPGPAAAFLAGALPSIVLLAIFKTRFAPPNDLFQSSLVAAAHRLASIERWGALVPLVLRRLVLLQAWGLHLLALALWLAFGRSRSRAPAHLRYLAWFPAMVMIVELCILVAQPHEVTWMFKVTIDRLLIQIFPSIILLVGCRRGLVPGIPS